MIVFLMLMMTQSHFSLEMDLHFFDVALFRDCGFNNALERVFDLHYMNNAETWKELVQKDMSIDFSWDSSASQYEELYEKAVLRARTASRS
ncbi:putative starch synthase 4, chloroplastic/amyloplastic [Datura stramonium]|uniref:Starch synthase 4, chloroplastic/amyloplastic n=1 Tax=Datura stramonium TaxID=4076 RepID=A0ABS8S8K8_DATST|nr:putative starch synthase 4, chloroplastic/amyloplastic [Datura stramonium]